MITKALTFEDVQKIPKVRFKQNIVLLLDQLTISENIAGIARLADAFQIQTIVLYHCTIKNMNKVIRMSRSTFNKLEVIECQDLDQVNKSFAGYHWLGLEWTNNSLPISEYKSNSNILLVIGSEKHGISDELLNQIEHSVHIDMFGINSSMNVASATGIALYQIRQSEINLNQKN